MITKRRKLIGALLVILEDRRGPPFFVRHRLDIIKKKSKGIYPFVLIYFPMLIFTRTYIRNRMPHTCYFSKCLYFYILRFDSQFKIKEFISYEIYIKGRKKNNQRYYAIRTYFELMINMKIILPLMARTYVPSMFQIIFVKTWRVITHRKPYLRMLKGFLFFTY